MKLNEVFSSLRSVYDEWSPNLLVNNRAARVSQRTIGWDNFDYRILDYPIRVSDVRRLADTGQYSFQSIMDNALFQLAYYFNSNGDVTAANLAYYRTTPDMGVTDRRQQVLDEYQLDLTNPDDQDFLDEFASEITVQGEQADDPVGWLRIDYAPQDARHICHYDCHLHVSAFPNARIPVGGLPSPRQFVEMIVALFYTDLYEQHRLVSLEDGWRYQEPERMRELNRINFRFEHQLLQHIAFLRIPSGAQL